MASYILTVGNISNICLGEDYATTMFGKAEFYVTMENLTYTKRIFAPCEIHTVLSLKAVDNSTTTYPSLSDLRDAFFRQKVSLKEHLHGAPGPIAENYFVYKMKPCRSKNSEGSVILKVELSIFSMDKLMTVDKYCNAYTAKRLGEDVFKGELNKFWLDSGNQLQGEVNMQMLAFKNKNTNEASEVRQPYLVQYNETFYDFLARSAVRCGEMLYFEGGLLHLGMKPNLAKASTDQSTVADTIDYEDCIEKVLAVHERHYNFFNRSSDNDNRYTDSYHELVGDMKAAGYDNLDDETQNEVDRIKNKGITTTDGKVEDGLVTKTTVFEFERGKVTKTVQTTYYKESDAAPDNQLKGQPKQETITISVTDRGDNELWTQTKTVTYNYEKSDPNQYKKNYTDFVCWKEESQPKIKGQEVEGIYNQPEPNDAIFEELKKDGYTNFSNESFDLRLMALNILYSALNNTSLYDIISDLAWSAGQTVKDALVSMEKKNDQNNDKNLTLDKTNNPEQTDGTIFNLFSTLKSIIDESDLNVNKKGDIVSLLMADFYAKMRSASQSVSQMLVRLNYGANDLGLCLGDVINVEGGFYVVIKVELDENNNYIVEAIPPFYKKVSTDNTTISEAIPCPPLMPEIPTVRTAEAQVAFVEDNLDPNRFGRVRVRYPWQPQNGDQSPWVRMATPFATAGGGVTFRPCTGDEVLLNYEDGNIERPYIVGSLQSRYVTDPWLPLPDRVIRSKNGHSITFNDKTDGLDFLWGMSPGASFIRSVIPLYKPAISKQNIVDLTGGINITDRYGLYQINMSSDKRTVNIASPLGNISLNAFTGITISAPNGNVKIEGKNVSISASNKLSLTSGTAVGDHWVPTSKKGIAEQLATDVLDRTIGKWLDLSFFRTILEVFTRPVDGTLKIKSNSYLLIEAGKGSAKVSPEDYRHPTLDKVKSPGEFVVRTRWLGKLNKSIDMLTSKVDTLVDNIVEAHKALKVATDFYKNQFEIFQKGLYDQLPKMKLEGNDDILSFVYNHKDDNPQEFIKDDIFGFENVDVFKIPDKNIPQQGAEESSGDYKKRVDLYEVNFRIAHTTSLVRRSIVVQNAIEVAVKLIQLIKAVDALKNFEFTEHEKKKYYTSDDLRNTLKGLDFDDSFISNVSTGTVDLDKDFGNIKTVFKRKLVYELIKEAKDADYYKWLFGVKDIDEPNDYGDNGDWEKFAEKIGDSTAEAGGKLAAFGIEAKNFAKHYFMEGKVNPWMDSFFNIRNKWKAEGAGKILISDTAGETICFENGLTQRYDNYGTGNSAYSLELRKKVNGVK